MPAKFVNAALKLEVGALVPGATQVDRGSPMGAFTAALDAISYERVFERPGEGSDGALRRGEYRVVGGGVLEVWPAADDAVLRVTLFDPGGAVATLERLERPTTPPAGFATQPVGHDSDGELETLLCEENLEKLVASLASPAAASTAAHRGGGGLLPSAVVYPARHHVMDEAEKEAVLGGIALEMEDRCTELAATGREKEAARLRQRTTNDLLMLRLVDTCKVSRLRRLPSWE